MANQKRDWLKARREALGLTQREVMEDVGAHNVKTVQRWESGDSMPSRSYRRKLSDTLKMSFAELERRFDPALTTAELKGLGEPLPHVETAPTATVSHGAETGLASDDVGISGLPLTRRLRTAEFLHWFDTHAAIDASTAYRAVFEMVQELEATPPPEQWSQTYSRQGIRRVDVTDALEAFYEPDAPFYKARIGDVAVSSGVCVPQPEQLDLTVALGDGEKARFRTLAESPPRLDEYATRMALRRLAQVEVMGTTVVDRPLYRLLDLDSSSGLAATYSTTSFLTYALTADLLEGELLENVGHSSGLPLREAYLPSLKSALDYPSRNCVGGAEALLAVARKDVGDYLLLAQARSGRVLNLNGRLTLIPKAFHQPVIEPMLETSLEKTLEREIEEELLGRVDLEMLDDDVRADPLHPARRSEPMRWLLERRHTGAFRIECTGFGINMVTGNFHFPCLIVIDDPDWWTLFGHLVEASWETARLHRHSTLDTDGLTAFAADDRWTSEGLFTYIQGLRRLSAIGTRERLALPNIEVER